MIICSCAVISSQDVERAVAWMRAADPAVMITPGKVYRTLGRKPACGGCLKLFVAAIHAHPDDTGLPMELRGLRIATQGQTHHERRRQGHRVSQQGFAE